MAAVRLARCTLASNQGSILRWNQGNNRLPKGMKKQGRQNYDPCDSILPGVEKNIYPVRLSPDVPLVEIVEMIGVHQHADAQGKASGGRRSGGRTYAHAHSPGNYAVTYRAHMVAIISRAPDCSKFLHRKEYGSGLYAPRATESLRHRVLLFLWASVCLGCLYSKSDPHATGKGDAVQGSG